jgi:hypothetical protein
MDAMGAFTYQARQRMLKDLQRSKTEAKARTDGRRPTANAPHSSFAVAATHPTHTDTTAAAAAALAPAIEASPTLTAEAEVNALTAEATARVANSVEAAIEAGRERRHQRIDQALHRTAPAR